MLLALLALMAIPDAAMPPALPCAVHETKTIAGRVMRYDRSRTKTVLRIRTDARTFEDVTIQHPKGDPSPVYLINQRPFARGDWKKLEARKGFLWPAMRATVMLCPGGEAIVDWHPDGSK